MNTFLILHPSKLVCKLMQCDHVINVLIKIYSSKTQSPLYTFFAFVSSEEAYSCFNAPKSKGPKTQSTCLSTGCSHFIL